MTTLINNRKWDDIQFSLRPKEWWRRLNFGERYIVPLFSEQSIELELITKPLKKSFQTKNIICEWCVTRDEDKSVCNSSKYEMLIPDKKSIPTKMLVRPGAYTIDLKLIREGISPSKNQATLALKDFWDVEKNIVGYGLSIAAIIISIVAIVRT
jgi:hypothetical protein